MSEARNRRDLLRFAITAGGVGVSIAFIAFQERTASQLLVVLFMVVVALPFWAWRDRGPNHARDPAEPIYLISLLYLMYFGVRSFYVLHADWDPRLRFLPSLDGAIAYATVGVLAMQLGYRSRLGKELARRAPQLRLTTVDHRSANLFIALWCVVLACRFYLVKHGLYQRFIAYDVSDGDNAVAYIAASLGRVVFALGAVIAVPIEGREGRWFKRAFWMLIVPLELLWALIGGEKKLVIYVALTLGLAYHYLKRAVTLRRMILSVTVLLITVFPIVNFYRQQPVEGLGEAISDAVETPTTAFSVAGLRGLSEMLIWRFPGIDSVAVEMEEVSTLRDVYMGETILRKLVALVPKFVMPTKNEVIRIGSLFNRDEYGDWVHADLPIMQLGELYLNFHVLGVVGGMFLFGVAYRLTYNYFIERAGIRCLFVYIPLLLLMLNIETDIGILASEIIRQTVFGVMIVLSPHAYRQGTAHLMTGRKGRRLRSGGCQTR